MRATQVFPYLGSNGSLNVPVYFAPGHFGRSRVSQLHRRHRARTKGILPQDPSRTTDDEELIGLILNEMPFQYRSTPTRICSNRRVHECMMTGRESLGERVFVNVRFTMCQGRGPCRKALKIDYRDSGSSRESRFLSSLTKARRVAARRRFSRQSADGRRMVFAVGHGAG